MFAVRLRSVRHKLILMVLVANLCTLVAAGGALFFRDIKEHQKKMVAELTALADILAQGSAAALEFDDAKVANEDLAQLSADPNIVAAAFYKANGSLFARYVRSPGNDSDVPAAPGLDGFRFEGGNLVMFRRIVARRELLGTIYLKEHYALSKWLGDYLVFISVVMFASLALGLLISTRLQRWISDPIQAVSAVARKVMAQRNFHLRVQKTTEDEVGQLAEAFNGMLRTLEHEIAERSAAEQALRILNSELEQRVAKRTAELQIANQTLASRTEEAEAANRAKANFLANMSHEIRTPMNGILGLAYLLERKHLDADSSTLVKKIRVAGRSLQAIINDILDFSKIEAGRLEIECAPFQLVDVFENLASIMTANAGDKDLELVIAPPPGIHGQLLGDALRLEQVLTNLTVNAIKFTEVGNVTVGIDLLAQDEKVATLRFSVTDTGIGIPAEKQTQIFDSFSQADTSTTRRFGGTGLGLTICKQLVAMMGGEIGVESIVGQGSQFWFTIPFECVPLSTLSPTKLVELNLLIADDSDVARENIAMTARSLGWFATPAASGEVAIQKVLTKRGNHAAYDVLLLDLNMPQMGGLAAASALRHTYNNQSLPILLMVPAFSRDEVMKQPGIELIDGILSKPVTSSSLYNGVLEALGHRGHGGIRGLVPTTGDRRYRRIPGVRALVVDDSDINREVALRILEADGAVVSLANDGKAAMDWLQNNYRNVDIVLMDVQMPLMDGYEATRQIRRSPLFATLPIIALTAGAFKAQQDAARQAGMNAFVAKPFNVEELITVIQQLTHCQPELAPDENAQPVAAAAISSPRVQNLPGIDLRKGLSVWNDLGVYRQYLRKFATDYADFPQKLAACYAIHDENEARALLHKLKGVAANLALTDVAKIASEAEVNKENAGLHAEQLSRLQAALESVFGSISQLSAEPSAAVALQPLPGNSDRLAPLLAELLDALDTDTPDRANQILDELALMMAPEAIAKVRNFIDDFDFRGAEAAVRQLAFNLGLVLKES